jgi:predicted nucleotidyltransferase
MLKFPEELKNKHKELDQWNILHVFRGSVAHNMYNPDERTSIDDIDTMAVYVPPKNQFLGFGWAEKKGTKEIFVGNWDVVAYDVRKAMRLLSKGNPNVLSMLWVKEEHVLSSTAAGRLLRDNRMLFSTREAYFPFQGYAKSQLKKMGTKERNGFKSGKRKALIEKYGYDPKNAAHLLRLLKMGTEFMNTGEMQVYRKHDAEFFMEVKRGEYSEEYVREVGENWDRRMEEAYENSPLRDKPDFDAINQLCVEMVELSWKERG